MNFGENNNFSNSTFSRIFELKWKDKKNLETDEFKALNKQWYFEF
jgi:hypothetical protein